MIAALLAEQVTGQPLHTIYDKLNRRVEISATITEAIAEALETRETCRTRSQASLKGT